MTSVRLAVVVTSLALLMVLSLFPRCFGADFESSFWVLEHSDSSRRYELNVSVSSSLYDYFIGLDHNLRSRFDFGKFVTPAALKPMADSLWSIYGDDEDFANGVLMIVHQIPYAASAAQKFPVETIVENEGDCDLLSFVAASVLMAGGLDVVLLFYESEDHMNVGVSLSHAPYDTRSSACYFVYDGRRYYMAEATGGNWETGWRVGECPESLEGVSAQVVTLEDAQHVSPGQVSSSFGVLEDSSITLSVSSTLLIEGGAVEVSGLISSVSIDGVVSIYVSSGNSSWVVLGVLPCDSSGRYSYEWKPAPAGLYFIRASWSGDADHGGADSSVCSVRVISSSLVYVGIIFALLAIAALVVFAVSRRVGPVPE